jgi:hypothetical protein
VLSLQLFHCSLQIAELSNRVQAALLLLLLLLRALRLGWQQLPTWLLHHGCCGTPGALHGWAAACITCI